MPAHPTTWMDPEHTTPVEGSEGRRHSKGKRAHAKVLWEQDGMHQGTAKKGFGVAGGEGAPGGTEDGGRG